MNCVEQIFSPISLTQSTTPTIFHHVSSSNEPLTWWRDIQPEVPAMSQPSHIFNLTHSDKTPVTRGLCSWFPPTFYYAFTFSPHLPYCELNKSTTWCSCCSITIPTRVLAGGVWTAAAKGQLSFPQSATADCRHWSALVWKNMWHSRSL